MSARRLAGMGAVALVLPVVAWRVAAAEPPPAPLAVPPPPCDPSTTSTTTTTTVAPSTSVPDPCTEPTTTLPPTTVPPPETTLPPDTLPPETPPATTVDPAATTVPEAPPASIDPAATTVAPAPAVDPVVTTTTAPVELAAEVVAPPESEAGRVAVPTGVTETGQVRPITFPVAGPVRYFNDFGACRDSCRRQHKGNDIIGDRLQPLLAMQDGVVDRLLDHPTAGFGIVIRDAEGWEYHLYHMNNDTPGTDDGADDGSWRFATGIGVGAVVEAGQVLGWMGDSGNSEGSVPHAHVEIHTPSGAAINPFWSLRLAQRDVNCAIAPVDPAAPVASADPAFLEGEWSSTELLGALPGDWISLSVTGGRPGSGATSARMWIGPAGYTPVDAAAVRVGDPRWDQDCTQPIAVPASIPAELGAILATIRAMETGGNYLTQVTSSTASGAYGFLDSSWGGYGGYARARDAPPPVQDAKAADLATYILQRNAGDVSTIPVSWYIGHVPIGAEWDTVPTVGNNKLTPREYQERWLRMYARVLGTPEVWVGTDPAWAAVDTTGACRTVVVDLGLPGEPEYGLTQARSFVGDATGRAVPAATDPCDPNRPVVVEPPSTAPPTLRPGGPS